MRHLTYEELERYEQGLHQVYEEVANEELTSAS